MLPAETTLHLHLKLNGEELTVNGLVGVLDELEGQLFGALVDAIQRDRLEATRSGDAPPIRCPRCESAEWVKRGSRPRQLKTTRGTFRFQLRQITCKACERTWSPLVEGLGLEAYQRVTEELRESLVGLVTELSYRKTSRWGEQMLGTTLAPMTLWREVQKRGRQVEFTFDPDDVERIEVDGTKVPAGPRKRGEPLNLAFSIEGRRWGRGRWRRRKRLVGMGLGSGSWKRALPPELSPELVVSDGGTDVVPAVRRRLPDARLQRCEWHLVHSLDYQLWKDGRKKPERDRRADELHALLFEPLEEEAGNRRARIRLWSHEHFEADTNGRRFLHEAVDHVCYPRPSTLRTTSHAERAMRELNRRTDVGAPWSVPGIDHLLRLRLARRYNPDDYHRIWNTHDPPLDIEVQVSHTLPMSRP